MNYIEEVFGKDLFMNNQEGLLLRQRSEAYSSAERMRVSPVRVAFTIRHGDPEVRGSADSGLSYFGRRQAMSVIQAYEERLIERGDLDIPLCIAICDSNYMRTLEMSSLELASFELFVKRHGLKNVHVVYLGSYNSLRSTDTFPVLLKQDQTLTSEQAFMQWMTASDDENIKRGAKTTADAARDIERQNLQMIARAEAKFDRPVAVHLWNNNHEANVGAMVKHNNLADPSAWRISPAEFVVTEFDEQGRRSYRFRGRHQQETAAGLIDVSAAARQSVAV
jgi:hypothetical protein